MSISSGGAIVGRMMNNAANLLKGIKESVPGL